VAYLRGRGHERIATIAGPPDTAVARGRLRGYERALEDAGEPLVARADFTREGGRAAMRELLGRRPAPTAVLCANDLIAVGALDVASEAGRAVPADLAIVGIDDIEAAAMVSPALTTVRIPSRDIGRVAGELLLERIASDRSRAPRTVLIAHELVVRESA
jgi:LacI family transcriptional regulator